MKKICAIIVMILMFCNLQTAFASTWKYVGRTTDDQKYYIDTDSIQHSKYSYKTNTGRKVTRKELSVWVRITNIKNDPKGATETLNLFDYTRFDHEFDCCIEEIRYYKNDKIIGVYNAEYHMPQMSVAPDTMLEHVYNAAKKTFFFW